MSNLSEKNHTPPLDQSIPAMIVSVQDVLVDTQKTKLANAVYEVIKDHLGDPHKQMKQKIKSNSFDRLPKEELKIYLSNRLKNISDLSENMKEDILNELVNKGISN